MISYSCFSFITLAKPAKLDIKYYDLEAKIADKKIFFIDLIDYLLSL